MKLKKNYFEDIQLLDGRAQYFWTFVLLLILACLPFLIKNYNLTLVNLMAVNAIVALGLNLLVGNTGQISLGHAGFVAIGAYATVLLMKLGLPFILAIIAGAFVAALFGALLGLPSLKLEGPYLAIATLGFGLAVTIVIGRTAAFGGRMGLSVKKLDLAWTGLKYDHALYYVIIIFTIMMTVFARNLLKSRIGRAFQAIRDSDIAASAIGVNLAQYKTLSFAISAFYAGIAGGLWAFYLGYINPNLFSFIMSVTFLATIVVGGLGSVTGSILGAIVMTYLSIQLEDIIDVPLIGQLLKDFSSTFMTLNGISNISWVFTGLILILVVLFEPYGLYGLYMRIKLYWKTWPF
jgi:branched-chain amino acid transport system permease protein